MSPWKTSRFLQKKHGEAGLLEVDVPWNQRKITKGNLDGQVFASSMCQQKWKLVECSIQSHTMANSMTFCSDYLPILSLRYCKHPSKSNSSVIIIVITTYNFKFHFYIMNIHHKCQFVFLFFPTNIVPPKISPPQWKVLLHQVVQRPPFDPCQSQESFQKLTRIIQLVGGWTNPFETYAKVKMVSSSPRYWQISSSHLSHQHSDRGQYTANPKNARLRVNHQKWPSVCIVSSTQYG